MTRCTPIGLTVGRVVLLALLAGSLALIGCGSGARPQTSQARSEPRNSSPTVAHVASRAISEADLTHWARLEALPGAVPTRAARAKALDFLILSQWLRGEAEELGVSIPVSVVEREATELVEDEAENAPYAHTPQDPELRQLLLSRRLDKQDRKLLVELALLVPKIESARIQRARSLISHDRLAHYYAANRRRFYLPNQRQVEIVGGLLSEVVQAKREIEQGQPFLEVARRRSSDPEAPGGLWRLISGHDEPPVEDQIFSARLHTLIGPKKYTLFYVFEVLEAFPAHEETLKEAETSIRKRLVAPGTALRAQAERRWRARTSCPPELLTPRCVTGGLDRASTNGTARQ